MRADPELLRQLMCSALVDRGLPDHHVAIVANGLLQTSLRGTDTHGIRLFETYLKELDNGRSNPKPRIAKKFHYPGVCSVDADHALGLVAGQIASETVVDKAAELGISAAFVRNSNHFGAASVYTMEMARHGCVGIALSNADSLVAPLNSGKPLLGTNPISIALPNAEDEPVCLDMATSQISYTRLMTTLAAGKAPRSGWAVDATGADLAEENGSFSALRPLGGYKGQGLGLMIALLCALLAAGPFDTELSHLYKPPYDIPRRVSHIFIAVHIARLPASDAFPERLRSILDNVRAWRTNDGNPVVIPGDPERDAIRDRSENGIPLTDTEWRFFNELAARHGKSLARQALT